MDMRTAIRLINFWPPLLFTGIRVRKISPDLRDITVELCLHWWNKNPAGSQFGGSLYAMTDPFYALMIGHALGPGYVIWDKAASIEYISPGRSHVWARFQLSQARIDEIRAATDGGAKYLPEFDVTITDKAGDIVARVKKTVYVRRKAALP